MIDGLRAQDGRRRVDGRGTPVARMVVVGGVVW
jgi:hypothetical protein